jgi:hypothetical protein
MNQESNRCIREQRPRVTDTRKPAYARRSACAEYSVRTNSPMRVSSPEPARSCVFRMDAANAEITVQEPIGLRRSLLSERLWSGPGSLFVALAVGEDSRSEFGSGWGEGWHWRSGFRRGALIPVRYSKRFRDSTLPATRLSGGVFVMEERPGSRSIGSGVVDLPEPR